MDIKEKNDCFFGSKRLIIIVKRAIFNFDLNTVIYFNTTCIWVAVLDCIVQKLDIFTLDYFEEATHFEHLLDFRELRILDHYVRRRVNLNGFFGRTAAVLYRNFVENKPFYGTYIDNICLNMVEILCLYAV